jgi:protein-S-isoprenylcysteine O-methyltransferase Ste14
MLTIASSKGKFKAEMSQIHASPSRPIFAIMLGMKSPLNRGGLRFYLVTIALAAGTLWAGTTSHYTILAGLPFIFIGVWLHTWAKGCLRQNRVVATIGPYRFVRHPFYLANALIDAGLVVMAGWWPLAVALPLWWLAIYIPVIRGEERYLTDTFPDEYPAYKRQVPCLVPWRRPLAYSGDSFRWSNPNIAGGEELPRAARILAYPLLFFVIAGLRNDRLAWFNDGWNLTGLAGLMMLYVLAWELHGHQRQQRWILPLAMRHPMLRVVASVAVLVAVCYVSGPRTGFRDFVSSSGAVLLLLSVPVYARRPARTVMAEALALLGVLAAGTLLWLAPALVVIYAAWMLDFQLGRANATGGPSAVIFPARFWPYFYPLLAVAAAAVIGVKVIGHGLHPTAIF